MQKKRRTALLLCCVICLSLASSLFCIAQYAGHTCHDPVCSSCCVMDQCKLILKLLSLSVLILFFLRAFQAPCLPKRQPQPVQCDAPTLVSLKVKMLD